MYVLKTKLNDSSVAAFLESVPDEKRRSDSFQILDLMQKITGEEPKMWGASIVGFGSYHYTYASGQEGDWMLIGFSPRKQNLSLYILSGLGNIDDLLNRLGKYTTGKGCLYINKLEDIDMEVLAELVNFSVDAKKKSSKPKSNERITVENINVPGYTTTLDATMYLVVYDALLKALPSTVPGLTQAEMISAVVPYLPEALFPGGAKAGWWVKSVQLDREVKGDIIREDTKPLRWHKRP